MNIFFTHPNPHVAANEHCNVHQVKMILEYGQLLSTAHRVIDGKLETVLVWNGARWVKRKTYIHPSDTLDAPSDRPCRILRGTVLYLDSHINHPSAVWVRESVDHYVWLYNCLMQLHKLYSDRTGKEHKALRLRPLLKRIPLNLECNGFTEPPVAAPEEFQELALSSDSATAYQHYLTFKFAEWRSRDKPMPVEWTCRVPLWYKLLRNKYDRIHPR